MKNHLIIHGHFYQPPREDPWTGLVPFQESAHPFHDWNHRITRECYAANTKSRILDEKGLITDILNNYCNLSFNFGPTLLSWLKTNEPAVLEAIIEADKISEAKNNGHGNAIAQSYNHTILPLCTEEDARTQILWGLEDFKSYFGREAEGMWLPEAGCDEKTCDLLIEYGVKFIILSPWQADSILPPNSEHWQSLNNNPIPSGRCYKMTRPGGMLNVFFYNQILAQGISFDHYLRNADQLYDKLLAFRHTSDKSYLVNTATDGEIYGHHEPFGDMCLAALSKIVETNNDYYFTNYANYLEQHPPEYEVKLKAGEGGKGTSWSCVHGVSRWYKDCGCSTGGNGDWNQEWRTPLREAFNVLNKAVTRVYKEEIAKYSTKDPTEIRNAYIKILTEQETRKDFASRWMDKVSVDQENLKNFYSLLEGQKFAQFMYTSCGWFFSEISGLEATQNMKYAAKVIDLYEQYNIQDEVVSFLASLDNAHSNFNSFGTGKNIYESWIIPDRKNLEYGATIFSLNRLSGNNEFKNRCYGIFKENEWAISQEEKKEGFYKAEGTISLTDYTTFNASSFEYSFSRNDMEGISINFKNKEIEDDIHEVAITALPIEMRRQISTILSDKVVDCCIGDLNTAYALTTDAMARICNLNVHASESITRLAELLVDRKFELIFTNTTVSPTEEEISEVHDLIIFCQKNKLKVNVEEIKEKVSNIISFQIQELIDDPEANPSKGIIRLLEACRSVNLEPEITIPQDQVFHLLKEIAKLPLETLEKTTGFKRMSRLIKLGSKLGLNVETYKERVFDI